MHITYNAYIRTVLARLLGLAVVLEDLFRADCYVAPRVRGVKKIKEYKK
jgi:hypothetical protein